MQNESLDKVVEYAIHFRRSTLFLIRQKHQGIYISRINFASLEDNNVVDPNDWFIVAPTSETDDDEKGNLNIIEDAEDNPDVEPTTIKLVKDPSSLQTNVPIHLSVTDDPSPTVNGKAPKKGKIL